MLQQLLLNLALTSAAAWFKSIGAPGRDEFMQMVGRAFGPAGCRHWSELTPEEQQAIRDRCDWIDQTHDDWPKCFRWVMRSLTVYVWDQDREPAVIYFSSDDGAATFPADLHADIPPKGTRVATDGHISWKSLQGFLVRFGFRWDHNARVLVLGFTGKQQ